MSQPVYLFPELDAAERAAGSWGQVRRLLGGKGANLADMTRLGIPVTRLAAAQAVLRS